MAKNCEPLPENPLSEETIARIKWLAHKHAEFTCKISSTGISTQELPGTGLRITVEVEDAKRFDCGPSQQAVMFAALPPENRLFALEFIKAAKRMGKI